MYIIEITCRRVTGKKKIKTLSLFQTKKEDFGEKKGEWNGDFHIVFFSNKLLGRNNF